ncbi:MAG: hypothetical protein ACRDM7_15575 [Thermoleophilaceae bacterium]
MRTRTTTTLFLALAAGLATGCGGDEEPEGAPIPQQAAADLESRLAEVERRMEAGGGACADIQNDTLPAVSSIVGSLPQDVDPEVRDSLERSFERLFQLTQEQCDEQKGQDTTEAEPPPPPETDTETTETAPPDEDETETEEAPPPEEQPGEELPPGQNGEPPPGQGGEVPGQGGGGGAIVPGEGE